MESIHLAGSVNNFPEHETSKCQIKDSILHKTNTESLPAPKQKQEGRGKKYCKARCCTGNLQPRGKPVKSAIDCHAKDIGLHYQKVKEMSDIDKFDLLKNVWKTPPGYSLPQHVESNRHWRFNSSYVDANSPYYLPWLVYSASYDGAFCLPAMCSVWAQSC